jgi:hypothetical protein
MKDLKNFIHQVAVSIPDFLDTKTKLHYEVYAIMSSVIASSSYLVSNKIYSERKLTNFNNRISKDIDYLILLCENNQELMFLSFDRIIKAYSAFKEYAVEMEEFESAENFRRLELINLAVDRD